MVDAAGLFVLGLVYGATVCSLTCLTYLGPFLMATGNGFRDGLISSLCFGFGKLCCYVCLGGLAGILGRQLNFGPVQTWAMGLTVIGVALLLPFAAKRGCQGACRPGRAALLTLGAATSLVPCPPVLALVTLAAGQGTLLTGMEFGLFYGLGIMISPLLIFGGGLSLISQKIRQEVQTAMPAIRGLAMAIMILLGANIIYGGLK